MALSFHDLCRILDLQRPSAVRAALKARKIRFSEDSKGRPWTTEAEMDRALSRQAAEVASIRDPELFAPDGRMNLNGGWQDGKWVAYRYSLERWRAQRVPSVGPVYPEVQP